MKTTDFFYGGILPCFLYASKVSLQKIENEIGENNNDSFNTEYFEF
jgi:hypothetical protein